MKGHEAYSGILADLYDLWASQWMDYDTAAYQRAMQEGLLQVFIEAGANVESSNCGPCFGSHMGVMSGKAKMISSSNRNYKGRMGSPDARIFLASPATVIASAIEGRITDPRKYL